MSQVSQTEYLVFVSNIKDLITSARATVARGVDLVQVYTNFEIGRRIVEQEQHGKDRAEYGQELIKMLSVRLTEEFGLGFSVRNLALMKLFYLQYQDRKPILQTLSAKSPSYAIPQMASGEVDPLPFRLSWSHYVFLLSVKNADERSFYEIECAEQDWTVRELKRQFDSSLYERLALSRDKEGVRRLAQEGQMIAKPADILKEPLVLAFLGLQASHRYSENDLESAIIDHLEHFLLELGKGFLFESRQRRFTFDSEHFFVDLVFYNRLLRCYVLIDLKLGRLTH